MIRRTRDKRSPRINYKRNHKNSKNQGIHAAFAEFLDRRIDEEFDFERQRLQKMIGEYTTVYNDLTPMSFTRTVTVRAEIPENLGSGPLSRALWEGSVRDVVQGIGEEVVRKICEGEMSDRHHAYLHKPKS